MQASSRTPAPAPAPAPPPWGRRTLCLWIAWLCLPVALLVLLAALPPGTYYALAIAAATFGALLGLPWLYAVGSALARGRRGLNGRLPWLLPLPLVGLMALWLLPSRALDGLVFRLARPALERALAEARELPEGATRLERAWAGPYRLREVRRYGQSAVVFEVAGTRGMRHVHGLVHAEPSGLTLLTGLVEGFESRPLTDTWHTYRAAPSWFD